MKKKTKIKKLKKEKNGLLKFIFFTTFVIILFAALWHTSKTESVDLTSEIASTAKNSIQIGTFGTPPSNTPMQKTPSTSPQKTLTPTPTTDPRYCSHDTGQTIDPNTCKCIALILKCENGTCQDAHYDARKTDTGNQCSTLAGKSGASDPCKILGDGYYCFGKPIIYLYPTTPTYVDVNIETSGNIFISDPFYPEGGWKNIFAYPSGKLEYQGNTYKELFYESEITDLQPPIYGLTLDTSKIEQELDMVVSKLGLINYEKEEFIEFWAPRLRALNKPYIFFSTITPSEKKRTDNVIINPKPDTFIEFIAYFKGLDFPSNAPVLELPEKAPERIGFTAVEWGGTIETNKQLFQF